MAVRHSTRRKATPKPTEPPGYLDPATLEDLYAMTINGDCLSPEYPHGSHVLIDRRQSCHAGDVVLVYFRPEVFKPGQPVFAWIKRLIMAPPTWVTFPWDPNPHSEIREFVRLGFDYPEPRQADIPCAAITAIHRVVGPFDPVAYDALCKRLRRGGARRKERRSKDA